MKKVVVMGGGTGTTAVLAGLRSLEKYDITVIVNMTDDGGSNAVIRDQFGLLPLSDLRKSIIALSGADQALLREIFTYRFDKGDGLRGHTIGNLIMMGLSALKGTELDAIRAASELFAIQGRVLPVTMENTTLVATYDDGDVVAGEHVIDEPLLVSQKRIVNMSVEPAVPAFPEAIQAIKEADVIIAGPGDLYTSTIASLVVDGIKDAIAQSNARLLFVSNLMTKTGQTHGMNENDLIHEITHYAGKKPEVALMHTGEFPEEVVEYYAKKHEHPIAKNSEEVEGTRKVYANVIAEKITERQAGDDLVRSLIRHDAYKLAKELERLIDAI